MFGEKYALAYNRYGWPSLVGTLDIISALVKFYMGYGQKPGCRIQIYCQCCFCIGKEGLCGWRADAGIGIYLFIASDRVYLGLPFLSSFTKN